MSQQSFTMQSGQQPNFGSPMGIPQPVFGQPNNQFGQPTQSMGTPLNFGNNFAHDGTGVGPHPSPTESVPVVVHPYSDSQPPATSTALVPHGAPKEATVVKTVVTIDEINMTTQTIETAMYRGGQMVRGQNGKMVMINYNNPVAIKVSTPERKAVSNRTKKNKPGTETKEQDNKAKDPNYWLTGIQYNYGTETNPQWRKGLTYTFGQGNPVWFSPVAVEEDEFEETGEDGNKKFTKTVSYKTSCRLAKSSPQGQKILEFYDHLRTTLALALKSPANGSPAADMIGLAEMDPNAPKDTEIRRFYNQRMDNGVPDPTADPTKYINIKSFNGKVTASFVKPNIIHGMLLHKAGNQFYLLNNKERVFYACDKDGHLTQIDPSTQQPTPIPASSFPHGTIAPEYIPLDPLTLKNQEFLGVPVMAMTGFYTSSGKASAQEKLQGMIVLDTRETQKGAQVKELGGTFDFSANTEIDYAAVAERFATLGIGAAPQSEVSAPPSSSNTTALTPMSNQTLDSFTGSGFN